MTWNEYLAKSAVLEPEQSIESAILGSLQGRLIDFWIEEHEDGVILRGLASSYHVKQLAQCEVLRLTPHPILANEIEVRPRATRDRQLTIDG